MHESANAIAANTAVRLGAWVTISLSTPKLVPSSVCQQRPELGMSSGPQHELSASVRHTGPFASESR